MELTTEGAEFVKDCRYAADKICASFVIRESGGMDYGPAAVLLRNLGEKKDITPLEREALATAIRVIRQRMEKEQQSADYRS